jgi:hypothetical protein
MTRASDAHALADKWRGWIPAVYSHGENVPLAKLRRIA